MTDDIDYIICTCGEHHSATVNKKKRRCRNCLNQHKDKQRCMVCGGIHPWENHHTAGRKFMPSLTIRVCMNCHAILTFWQERYYPQLLAQPATPAMQFTNCIVGMAAVFWLIYLRHARWPQMMVAAHVCELQGGSAISAGLPAADGRR